MARDRIRAEAIGRIHLGGWHLDRAPVSECYIVLPQGDAHTPVILGKPGDEALLGIVTLEILGLVLNPFSRELQPMRMLLGRTNVSAKI